MKYRFVDADYLISIMETTKSRKSTDSIDDVIGRMLCDTVIRVVDAISKDDVVPIEWLDEKERQAEYDVYYCKGDARKNVDIAHSIKVIKELWEVEEDEVDRR